MFLDINYMNRNGHENIKFFIGTEVEHTPAYNQRTLFVVGVQSVERILPLAAQFDCPHIYFGANMSFPNLKVNDGAE